MDIKNLIEDINAIKKKSFAVTGNSYLKTDIEDKSTKDDTNSRVLQQKSLTISNKINYFIIGMSGIIIGFSGFYAYQLYKI